jgi:hypothetical protein
MSEDEEANKQAEIMNKVEGRDADPSTDEVIEYLALFADKNPAKQQEKVDLVSQRTQFNKSTLRDILEEQKTKKSLKGFQIRKIVKITPINKEDDTVFEFHIEHVGNEYSFKIVSSELVGPNEFKKKILELTDQLVTFDSWNDQLNKWMEQCPLEVREEEPLKDANAVVEHIFNEFEMLQIAEEMKEFKQFPESMALMKEDDKEIWVSGTWIDSKVSSLNKDVSLRKVRTLLEDFMPNGKSKKVRKDDDQFRAWRFDQEKLVKIGVLEYLEDSEGDEQ